jgi:hypothetical protein
VYSDEEKKTFVEDLTALTELRKINETNNNSMLGNFLEGHELQRKTRAEFT